MLGRRNPSHVDMPANVSRLRFALVGGAAPPPFALMAAHPSSGLPSSLKQPPMWWVTSPDISKSPRPSENLPPGNELVITKGSSMMVVGESLVVGDSLDVGGSVDVSVSLDSKDSLDVGNSANVCDSVGSVSAEVGISVDVGASVDSKGAVDTDDSAEDSDSLNVEGSSKALLGISVNERAFVASVSGSAVEPRGDISTCEEVPSGGVVGEEDGSRDAPREEAPEDSGSVGFSEADSVGSAVPERGPLVFVVEAALLFDDVSAVRGRVVVLVSPS